MAEKDFFFLSDPSINGKSMPSQCHDCGEKHKIL